MPGAGRRIDAIEIGIGADISGLQQSLEEAAGTVRGYEFPTRTVPVTVAAKVDRKSFVAAEKDVVGGLRGKLDKTLSFTAKLVPTKSSVRDLITEAQKSVTSSNRYIDIKIRAETQSAKAIHDDIQKKVNAAGAIRVPIEWVAGPLPKPPGGGRRGRGADGGEGPPPSDGGGTPSTGGPRRPRGPRPVAPAFSGTVTRPTPAASTRPQRAAAGPPGDEETEAVFGAAGATGAARTTRPPRSRPTRARATVGAAVVPPSPSAPPPAAAGPELFEGGLPPVPGEDEASRYDLDDIASQVARVTWEDYVQGERKRLSKLGLIFGMEKDQNGRTHLAIKGAKKGSYFDKNPTALAELRKTHESMVLKMSAGGDIGGRGYVAVANRRERGFKRPGMGASAYRLAGRTRLRPGEKVPTLEQIKENLAIGQLNEEQYRVQMEREANEYAKRHAGDKLKFAENVPLLDAPTDLIEHLERRVSAGKPLLADDIAALSGLLYGGAEDIQSIIEQTAQGPVERPLAWAADQFGNPLGGGLISLRGKLRLTQGNRFYRLHSDRLGSTEVNAGFAAADRGVESLIMRSRQVLEQDTKATLADRERSHQQALRRTAGVVMKMAPDKQVEWANKYNPFGKPFKDEASARGYVTGFMKSNLSKRKLAEFMATLPKAQHGARVGTSPTFMSRVNARSVTDALRDIYPNADIWGIEQLLPEAQGALLGTSEWFKSNFPESASQLKVIEPYSRAGIVPFTEPQLAETKTWFASVGGRPTSTPIAAPWATGERPLSLHFNPSMMSQRRVDIDMAKDASLFAYPRENMQLQSVFAHELGHVVDRTHVQRPSNVVGKLAPPFTRYSGRNQVEAFAEWFAALSPYSDLRMSMLQSAVPRFLPGYRYNSPSRPLSEYAQSSLTQMTGWADKLKAYLKEVGGLERSGETRKELMRLGYAKGGRVETIGRGGEQIWQAPGPGWIIPHHLVDQVPGMRKGGNVKRHWPLAPPDVPFSDGMSHRGWSRRFNKRRISDLLGPQVKTDRGDIDIGIGRSLSRMAGKANWDRGSLPGAALENFERMIVGSVEATDAAERARSLPLSELRDSFEDFLFRHTPSKDYVPPKPTDTVGIGDDWQPNIRSTHWLGSRFVKDFGDSPYQRMRRQLNEKPIRRNALGGGTPKGMYVVGEAGPELFVPESLGHLIPKRVMDQLPRRAEGGAVEPPHAQGGVEVGDPFSFEGRTGFISPERVPRVVAATGMIQRVYVVNWPRTGGTGTGTGFGGVATGPLTIHERKVAEAIGTETAKRGRVRGISEEVGTTIKGAPKLRGAAPGTARSELSPKVLAEIQLGSLIAQYEPGGIRSVVASARSNVGQILQQTALRSPTVAAGEALAVTLGGRGGIQERVRLAELARQKQQAIALQLIHTQDEEARIVFRLGEATAKKTDLEARGLEVGKDLTDEIDLQTKALGENHESQKVWQKGLSDAGKEADILQGSVATIGQRLRVFGTNMLGVTGGMVAFSAVMGATQIGLEGISKVAGPAVDQLLNFQGTSERVTTALGKQTVETKGNIEATFGLIGATAGLSKQAADLAQQRLGPTAIAKAAGMVEANASDIFRGMAGAEPAKGLYGGYGGVLGGPFLAELLGGGKGFTEQIAGNVSVLREAAKPTVINPSEPLTPEMTALQGQIAALRQQSVDLTNEILQGTAPEGVGIGTVREIDERVLALQKEFDNSQTIMTDANKRAQSAYDVYIGDLNSASKRGAQALGEANKYFELVPGQAKNVTDNLRRAGAEAGDPTYAAQLADAGLAVRDATGRWISSGKEYEAFVNQLAKGRSMTDIGTYAKQITQNIRAQVEANKALTKFTRELDIPFQLGVGRAATGAQFLQPEAGINVFGVSSGRRTEINNTVKSINTMWSSLNKIGTQALDESQRFVQAWSGEGDAFSRARADVEASGKQIAGIQTKIFDTQIGLNNAQYSNSVRLASRAKRDAQALAGLIKGGTDNLGAVQRQQTMLGFGLQQRQITTQLALAQFQAPGQTGEERYYRQKEAIAEAKIAQQQLDLSRKAFGIESKRGVTDTTIQLGLIKMQWDAENLLIAKNKELATAQELAATRQSQLTKIYDEAAANYQLFMGEAAKAAGEFGTTLEFARRELLKTWTAAPDTGMTDYERTRGRVSTKPATGTAASVPSYLDVPKNTIFSTPGIGMNPTNPLFATIVKAPSEPYYTPIGKPKANAPTAGATGLLTNVSTATQFLVGEAGPETVAVLRNPRSMGIGGSPIGGGGASTVNVTVNYSGSGTAQDAHQLAVIIAAEVEREMARKGQLLGLRGAAY